MPRQTLPDFDPLAAIGILSAESEERPPRTARRPMARQLSTAAPAKLDPVPTAEPSRPDETAAPIQGSPVSRPESPVERSKAQGRERAKLSVAPSTTAAPRALKAKTSGRIDAELWEEVRDCVVWHGHRMTIDRFTEDAFREHLARLRRNHQLGNRFPAREQDPKQGRRVS